MEETRRKIQLHKKGDKNDQWTPLTTGSCVQLTDYKNDGVTDGEIINAVDNANNEFDDLNTALMKLENRKINKGDLHNVAFTGDYNDLENLPNIENVQSDWNEDDTESTAYINNKPNLAPVATSGDYDDLTNKPNLANVATSGDYDDLTNKPNLANVATSGDYDDLTNKPTIPVVNDATISFSVNGETFTNNSFTLNQSGNGTIDIPLPSFLKYISVANQESDLPVPSTAAAKKAQVGHVYKVGTSFNYNNNSETANVGDLFIYSNPSTNVYEWMRIPSGDDRYNVVVAGIAGLCPALPNDDTKFLDGKGNWTTPVDTDTKVTSAANHYTPSADNSAQLTASLEGTEGAFATDTEYSVVTGVKAQRDAKGHITGLTITKQKIKDTNTDTDTKVTSVTNHYAPSADNNSELTASLDGTEGAFVSNTEYSVVTGVKVQRDAKGHVTGVSVTKQKVKDTDTNNYRAINVNGTSALAANSNADVNFANGNNVSITENSGTITIGVSATDHYITSGDLTISSGVVSFALTAGHNYFVGTSADVSNLSALTTLNITINAGSNGACEANVFFKAASSSFHLNFYDGSNNALSVKVIGDEPEYDTNGEYLLSYYKGTIIFGVLSARSNS